MPYNRIMFSPLKIQFFYPLFCPFYLKIHLKNQIVYHLATDDSTSFLKWEYYYLAGRICSSTMAFKRLYKNESRTCLFWLFVYEIKSAISLSFFCWKKTYFSPKTMCIFYNVTMLCLFGNYLVWMLCGFLHDLETERNIYVFKHSEKSKMSNVLRIKNYNIPHYLKSSRNFWKIQHLVGFWSSDHLSYVQRNLFIYKCKVLFNIK